MDFMATQSEGTKKILEIASFISNAINKNAVVIIDEIDARLHLKLTKELIRTIHSSKAQHSGQLIYVIHDTNLVDPNIQRKDQLTFVEKDKVGSSHIYALPEVKGVSSDFYERAYLLGKFGALPFVDNYETVIE